MLGSPPLLPKTPATITAAAQRRRQGVAARSPTRITASMTSARSMNMIKPSHIGAVSPVVFPRVKREPSWLTPSVDATPPG